MVVSLGDYYKIDPEAFAATGALDPILGFDTRLFIDPSLLLHATTDELSESYARISHHFSSVIRVISAIQKEGDVFWRRADAMLAFPEVRGLCIGYSKDGTGGKGAGPKKRAQILATIHAIVKAGCTDEAIFELVGTFEDGVGPDLISDMIAKIIIADLIKFTQRVCSDLGIPMRSTHYAKGMPQEDLPFNPKDDSPVILVPREVLRDLPVAEDFSDIDWVASHNALIREQLNSLITGAYKASAYSKKEQLRHAIIDVPGVVQTIIDAYRAANVSPYDFGDDPAGETIWYSASRNLPSNSPLKLSLASSPGLDDVYSVVLQICSHFKTLVEDNQLCHLLWDKEGQHKKEAAAQLLFFGVAHAYCQANNLDLSPESDAGRGPVDFKVSSGFKGKVLVELKLTSNKNLLKGFNVQLPTYQAAENAERGIYLVINVGNIGKQRWQQFSDAVHAAGSKAPKVIVVDAHIRDSASKATSMYTDDSPA